MCLALQVIIVQGALNRSLHLFRMFMILTDLLFGSLKSVAGIFQFDFLLSTRKMLGCLEESSKILNNLFVILTLKTLGLAS